MVRGQINRLKGHVKNFKLHLKISDTFQAAERSDQIYISEDKSSYPKENRLIKGKRRQGKLVGRLLK